MQVERRSRKTDIIMDASDRVLGLKDFLVEELHGVLSQAVPPSQALEPEKADLFWFCQCTIFIWVEVANWCN
jgi:hypothetical protein